MNQTDMFKAPKVEEKQIQEWSDLPWYHDGSRTKVENRVTQFTQSGAFYPPANEVYNAFEHTPFLNVKVVILGQDPYARKGQAHGLAFSVRPGCSKPPSLMHIFRELQDDLGCPFPSSGDLTPWTRSVLLLNTILTVAPGAPMSHADLGWQELTSQALRFLIKQREKLVFILWGQQALLSVRGCLIAEDQWMLHKHLILHSAHPSPRSAARGFFGSRPFSTANNYLRANGLEEIEWCLP